jgi:hypothetical protein
VTRAYWFEHKERGGFPVLRAAVGDCDLSVMLVGDEWHWLVRREGCVFRSNVITDSGGR